MSEETELKNMMEEIVFRKMEEVMPKMGCCTCPKCILDVAAYALNRLPPKYVASEKGKILSKLDTMDYGQYEMDVVTAVVKGVQVISKNPHHDK